MDNKAESKDLLFDLLKKMLEIRYFETAVDKIYMEARIRGTGHLSIGMEAGPVGCIKAINSSDLITSNHRGHGHCIAKGASLKLMMAELFGKENGYCRGRGGSMHIADIKTGNLGANGIVGGSFGIATGAAFAAKKMNTNQIVLCFFGDGASNQGIFHESINIASIWKLPIIYVCENNQYGMGFPIKKAINVEKISDRACAYGIKGLTIDGNDVLSIYRTVSKLVNEVRSGGPILLELLTYRWKGHSRMDSEKYRTRSEVEEWKKKCPIKRFESYLLENKIATENELRSMEQDVNIEIEDAIDFAEKSPYPDPKKVEEDVYA